MGWRYRLLSGISALTYVDGARGADMLGAHYYQLHDEQVDLYYRLFQTVEETLEFTATITLLYTQLTLLRERIAAVAFRVWRT